MKITIIAAHDPNLVIGNKGSLPWHFSEDLKHFKKTTTGFPILMGRGVFEELGSKPLPNRQNIVLSTTRNYDNVACYSSLEQAIEAIPPASSVTKLLGEVNVPDFEVNQAVI